MGTEYERTVKGKMERRRNNRENKRTIEYRLNVSVGAKLLSATNYVVKTMPYLHDIGTS